MQTCADCLKTDLFKDYLANPIKTRRVLRGIKVLAILVEVGESTSRKLRLR